MIIVRIWEGLGNQLFQYAFARSLSLRTEYEISLDISHCARGSLEFEKEDGLNRIYALDKFNIKLPCIKCSEYNKMKTVSDDGNETVFNKNIYNVHDNIYVSAHCINKFYFQEHRDILLKELQLLVNPKLSDRIKSYFYGNTVSIHIRLTDYMQRPFHICSSSYYKTAIEYIEELYPDAIFFVFTDDMSMARELYPTPRNAIWIGEEGLTDVEELWLMSKCKHHIMAASTFSYWGTWLSDYRTGIVIGPKTWMVNALYEKEWRIL